MKSNFRALSGVCPLLCALLLLTAGDAKADPIVINFDDVDTSAGPVRVEGNRYRALGVDIFGQAEGAFRPFVGQSPNVAGGLNFVFSQRTSPLGEAGDGSLGVSFYLPGTSISGATNFVSFSVIDTGQSTPFQVNFFGLGPDGLFSLGFVRGVGNAPVSFSTQTNQIFFFSFSPNPSRQSSAVIGISNLTFNTPQTPIPEPTTMMLLGTGLAGVGAAVRRRRKARSREEA